VGALSLFGLLLAALATNAVNDPLSSDSRSASPGTPFLREFPGLQAD
jgi:hypothetical protein